MKLNPQKVNIFVITNKNNTLTNDILPFRETNFNIYFQDESILAAKDFRGAHTKFWIYPKDTSPHLCKFAKNIYSPIGELIMTKVFDSFTYPHAKYFPVILRLDNGIGYGTASPDILTGRTIKTESGKYEETSARSLASKYINLMHDNNYGMPVVYEHTVDFYLKALEKIEKCDEKTLKKIKTDMLKVALIQGLFLMNDLHEENLGFLKNKENNEFELMPLYDYGSCLQLDWNFETTFNKVSYFKPAKNQDELTSQQKLINKILVNKKNALMFGFHTPLMEASTDIRTTTNTRKNTLLLDSIDILFDELATEMKNNKELSDFYKTVKENTNFNAIRQYYQNCKNPLNNEAFIPDTYFDIAEKTFTLTTIKMDMAIKKAENEKNQTARSKNSKQIEMEKIL